MPVFVCHFYLHHPVGMLFQHCMEYPAGAMLNFGGGSLVFYPFILPCHQALGRSESGRREINADAWINVNFQRDPGEAGGVGCFLNGMPLLHLTFFILPQRNVCIHLCVAMSCLYIYILEIGNIALYILELLYLWGLFKQPVQWNRP